LRKNVQNIGVKNNNLKSPERKYKRIAIKVGSNVVTREDGTLNTGRMLRIVEDLAVLLKRGTEVILISSGAVAAGRNAVSPSRKTNIVAAKQVWAAIGQVHLMSTYQFLFGKYDIQAGQVLATKESFGDRRHYLNMKNCISAMIENKVLPIINENDTISVNELMFTDNDELSGLISSMMDCESLFILSNVDGLFNGNPDNKDAELIRKIEMDSGDIGNLIYPDRSGFGRGGMQSKYGTAKKIASLGIDVFIANGNRDCIVTEILKGKDIPYTHFIASDNKKNSVKKWLSHSDTFARGAVHVNSGAREVLLNDKVASLLMIGVVKIEGSFRKGDIVRIIDENGKSLGIGKSQYESEKAKQYIGERESKPLIKYDHMLINENLKTI
jgi:glutamate 5-kinase